MNTQAESRSTLDKSINLSPKDILTLALHTITIVGLYFALLGEINIMKNEVAQLKSQRLEDNSEMRGTLETLTHEVRNVREDQREMAGKFSVFLEIQNKKNNVTNPTY